MFCRQCGHTLECPNCSVSLTVHPPRDPARALPLLQLLDAACRRPVRNCAGPYLEQIGFGTERVEAECEALLSGRARRARRPRHHPRAAPRRLLARFAAASSTCSSARR
jgi:primosomal protein N' (replication factor Y) (superfamily II helicase)